MVGRSAKTVKLGGHKNQSDIYRGHNHCYKSIYLRFTVALKPQLHRTASSSGAESWIYSPTSDPRIFPMTLLLALHTHIVQLSKLWSRKRLMTESERERLTTRACASTPRVAYMWGGWPECGGCGTLWGCCCCWSATAFGGTFGPCFRYMLEEGGLPMSNGVPGNLN